MVEPFENRFCPYERQCAILGFSLNLNLEIVSFFIYSLVALNIFFENSTALVHFDSEQQLYFIPECCVLAVVGSC